MFNAILLSLVDGQSYKNVTVLDPKDFPASNTPELFEEWTFAFLSSGKRVMAHAFNIKVIHLHKRRLRNIPNTVRFDRLVMLGDASYSDGEIILPQYHKQFDIPDVFIQNFGMLGQLTFMTHEGVFVTSDYNVTTLMLSNDHAIPVGIKRGHLLNSRIDGHGVPVVKRPAT